MAKDRKSDHIQLAFDSHILPEHQDRRFLYEPVLAAHPSCEPEPFLFLGKRMNAPFWISSMTGGTGKARAVNRNIARVCRELGLGMGLGSCRCLLTGSASRADFDVRDELGAERPLWANLGIVQVEQLLAKDRVQAIVDVVNDLRADGLIIHVNPLQEWFQPEGERITRPPLETIGLFLQKTGIPVIVKEVGQGMGPESLKELLQLPLAAIELAALGGTNFSRLELTRSDPEKAEVYRPFVRIGHSAEQMVRMVNLLLEEISPACSRLIISGGIRNFLDGYFLVSLSRLPAVFGMASGVLKYAGGEYRELREFLETQINAYRLAQAYLKLNPEYDG